MQQQILFCYPFFRIGQWEFTPSCIFVLFFLIAFPIAHLNIWQKSNQKDCFSDFTYVIHLRKIWADIVLRRKTLQLLGAYVFCFMLYWLRPSVGNIDLEKHWLFAFADYYLHYESLLSLIIVFLSMGTILINSGKEQYVRVLNHVVVFYFIISAACMQITRQLRWGWSVPTLAVLFGLSVMLETCDVIGKHTNESLPNTTFLPIERYDQLFELRQVQADELRELIIGSADEPISICVSGDWGSGKTSLVNGALAELKKCEGCGDNYEIIRVNALELDSLQSLKTYVSLDGSQHNVVCVCGKTIATAPHDMQCTPNADGLTHKTSCNRCGWTSADEQHDFRNGVCVCGIEKSAEYGGKQYAFLQAAVNAAA